jgi:hypothetical protein
MLRSMHFEPGCYPSRAATYRAAGYSRPIAPSLWPVVTGLRAVCGVLHEGLIAYRRYERLRSRGMPHETALTEAVGGVPGHSVTTR